MTTLTVTGSASVNGIRVTTTSPLTLNAPPPPPPSGAVYGASFGTSSTWTIANLAPRIVRTYDKTGLGKVPAGTPVMHSTKPSLPVTTTSALIAEGALIEDIDGCYWTIWHEGDKDGLNTADYVSGWVSFTGQVLPAVNAKRKHPIKSLAIVTGTALSRGNIAPYLAPSADCWGVDIYSPGNIKPNAAWIKANGDKPWCVPEMGYVAGGQPGDGTDAQKLARLKSDVAAYLALPNPPFAILEFNNNGSYLGPGPANLAPLSAAWWKQLTLTGKAA